MADTEKVRLNSLNADLVGKTLQASLTGDGSSVNVHVSNVEVETTAEAKAVVKKALQTAIASL